MAKRESVLTERSDIQAQRDSRLDARQVEAAKKSGVRRPSSTVATTVGEARKLTGPPRKGSVARRGLDQRNAERTAARSDTNRAASNAALERRNAPARTSTDRLGGRTGSVVGGGKVTTTTVPGSAGSMSTTPADARANKIEGRDLARAQTDLKAADARVRRNLGVGGQRPSASNAERTQSVIEGTKREQGRERTANRMAGGKHGPARPAAGGPSTGRRGRGMGPGGKGGMSVINRGGASGGSPAHLLDLSKR